MNAQQQYAQKLQDPRWQKKRLEILQRDNFTCQLCWSNTNSLQVHHKLYIKGREPWEYDNILLVTLCADCHTKTGESQQVIREFFSNLTVREISSFAGKLLECRSRGYAESYLFSCFDEALYDPLNNSPQESETFQIQKNLRSDFSLA